MKLLILTGMSGAGKSTALKALEDLGYNCVDNLPVPLLKSFTELSAVNGPDTRVAVGIDIRNGSTLEKLEDILPELENDGKSYDILFLDAEDEVLVRRYKETRRTPPLAEGGRIEDGLKKERVKMQFLRDKADYVLDTSHMLGKDLKAELQKVLSGDVSQKSLNINILSFGYKYGIPEDADMVFDVRFLPNPYYVDELRPLTGNDQVIRDYVMQNPDSHIYLDKVLELIRFLIPRFIKEGRSQLVICFGCTGGKHRSITIANEVYEHLSKNADSYSLHLDHVDIDKK